ncbi:MAG: Gfo/Idh/MocA family oxidoreductase [Acidobacteria bacterium]|nr:Gfo/Idh/MocA family oxidoreductase [Acidobacteriota bacterium]
MTRRVGWGLVGCGDIARRRVAPALRDLENCELVGVSRADAARAEGFAAEFDARRWHADWRDLLIDPEVEAVYVATPIHLHAEQAVAAAEAGKHVLCEKPMALNAAECERMNAAAEHNGVRLGVAYYRRFYPVVARVAEILRSGEIGVAVFAQMNAFERFDPAPDDPRRWLLDKKLSGGGPMFDFGCHRIEVLLNLFGPPIQVRAVTSHLLLKRAVEDSACALFHFESGAQAVLSVTHAAHRPQDTLEIFGTLGSARADVLNEGRLRVTSAEGSRVESHPPHTNYHQPLIDDFARAVVEGRRPRVDGRDGQTVSGILDLIYAVAPPAAGGRSRPTHSDRFRVEREGDSS